MVILFAWLTYWLALKISQHVGTVMDKKFNREGFVELSGRGLLMFLQTPVIFIYSLSLGVQL